MSVYIVAAPEQGLVKIGYSMMPYVRLSSLRLGSPVELTIAAIIPGNRENEKQLHARFSRDRSHGEWFKFNDDIADLIAAFRVEKQSLRRRPLKTFGHPSQTFDAERNSRWLEAYEAERIIGFPVTHEAVARRMATYRPESAAA